MHHELRVRARRLAKKARLFKSCSQFKQYLCWLSKDLASLGLVEARAAKQLWPACRAERHLPSVALGKRPSEQCQRSSGGKRWFCTQCRALFRDRMLSRLLRIPTRSCALHDQAGHEATETDRQCCLLRYAVELFFFLSICWQKRLA